MRTTPPAESIAAVRGLEALGAEVLVTAADVAREDEVRAAIAAAQGALRRDSRHRARRRAPRWHGPAAADP